MILTGASPCSHNFSPFLDTCPGVKPDARFKALAGTQPGGGLYAFKSGDGVHWKKMQAAPVMQSQAFAFDSQNVSFWSEVEHCYVCSSALGNPARHGTCARSAGQHRTISFPGADRLP